MKEKNKKNLSRASLLLGFGLIMLLAFWASNGVKHTLLLTVPVGVLAFFLVVIPVGIAGEAVFGKKK
ncbi:MAG: hypothetical protein WCT50_04260 [Patescibacteria group bacterium]|jgi:hypothetical protein